MSKTSVLYHSLRWSLVTCKLRFQGRVLSRKVSNAISRRLAMVHAAGCGKIAEAVETECIAVEIL